MGGHLNTRPAPSDGSSPSLLHLASHRPLSIPTVAPPSKQSQAATFTPSLQPPDVGVRHKAPRKQPGAGLHLPPPPPHPHPRTGKARHRLVQHPSHRRHLCPRHLQSPHLHCLCRLAAGCLVPTRGLKFAGPLFCRHHPPPSPLPRHLPPLHCNCHRRLPLLC